MKTEIDNNIGERIKLRRKELRLTGKQIYDLSGISTGNLSSIEAGKVLPSSQALISLSIILNCSIDWMLTGKTPKSEFSYVSATEEKLLAAFRELSIDDQDEVLDIIEMKLSRAKLKGVTKSEILNITKNA